MKISQRFIVGVVTDPHLKDREGQDRISVFDVADAAEVHRTMLTRADARELIEHLRTALRT